MPEITRPAATEERRGKRRAVVAGALAVLAVGGIGAALTSAAWTDSVFYTADAQAATFNLQGSLDGQAWVESDDPSDITLIIPATALADLVPGQTRTVDLWVKNDSTVTANLAAPTAVWSGSTFTADPPATLSGLVSSLAPGATDMFTLTVTVPGDWDDANQGETGTLVVTVEGTAAAS